MTVLLRFTGFWPLVAAVLLGFSIPAGAATPVAAPKAPGFGTGSLTVQTREGSHAFTVEIATTPQQQQRGLMYRNFVPADRGMLFVWPQERPVSMWMKNTPASLDIFFINGKGVITHIAPHTVPYSTDIISAPTPVRYVLEVAAGTAQKKNIALGDRVISSEIAP